MAVGKANGSGAVFYRFQDASGRVHLVDSLDSVPQAERAHAQRIEYGSQNDTTIPSLTSASGLPSLGALSSLESFGLGFGAALVAVFLFSRLPGTLRLVLRLAIIGGVVALMAGAYFGWLRRTTHQSGDAFAGPGALIDDARS